MKSAWQSRLVLVAIVLATVLAVVTAQIRRPEAPVGPWALLNFLADFQREVSRVPARATRLSDAEEIEIGNGIAAHIAQFAGPVRDARDAEIESYLRRVGGHLAARARRKLPYTFHYIPDPGFINAFALPGGHIFFGEGLLRLMKTEDELAAVLGHEISHVDFYHCAERVQVEARLRKIPLGRLIELPIEVFQAGYTKAQELEADREGVRLAFRAGYSPFGAVKVFETFEMLRETYVERARNPQEEISQIALEILRGYFRSHPLPAERIQQVRELIHRNNWQNKTATRPLEVASLLGPPATPQPAPLIRTR